VTNIPSSSTSECRARYQRVSEFLEGDPNITIEDLPEPARSEARRYEAHWAARMHEAQVKLKAFRALCALVEDGAPKATAQGDIRCDAQADAMRKEFGL
jgi:hypothetical protein